MQKYTQKIMWPSSQASKMLIGLIFNKFSMVLIFCIVMDILLFLRIRSYKIDIFDEQINATSILSTISSDDNYEDITWVPCSVNPLCHPTVKALMIDPINHYIYGPFSSLMDISLGISKNMLFLTPNMISYFHVFIAMIAGKLFAHQNLTARRLGVFLFQVRMILDDLDGHVARERKHIKGERSEVGTLGYWVDGLCDMVGVIAMIVGLLIYLKNHPPRRNYNGSSLPYHQLKEINNSEDVEKENLDIGVSYKTKVSLRTILQVVALFSGQMLVSSLMWNRYIDIYQELLENSTTHLFRRRSIFRSWIFFTATGLWRIVNPHCYLHLLSIAVFYDKTWSFLRLIHHYGYLGLVFTVAASEYFVSDFRSFLSNGVVT